MSDSYVQVAPDSTGKFIDNTQLTQSGGTIVQRQRVTVGDNTNVNNYLAISSTGAASVSGSLSVNLTATQLTPAIINISSSGLNALVSAQTGKTIKVYRLWFIVGGTTTLTFQDGASALSGAFPMLQGGGLTLDLTGDPWYTGSTNTAFNLNSTNAVTIAGNIYYVAS